MTADVLNIYSAMTETPEEYKDIAPYDDAEFKSQMAQLISEPGFEHAIRYVMPDVDFNALRDSLMRLDNKEDFQKLVMMNILLLLEKKTTAGVSDSGIENFNPDHASLFITNHRDIVLDASFLGLAMIRRGLQAQEIALGDNLLIYEWIEKLVRLNKGIIVKRNLRLTKALEAARQLSGYIHHCIMQKNKSVWIAQREGRAKDSNDVTQDAVLKMLALAGDAPDVLHRLMELNIIPTSISYEYDPNDYLKAKEFLSRRRDPAFKKCQRDDLLSMETGILKYKGRVHFSIRRPINPELESLVAITDKNEVIRKVCEIIDREIHLGYRIYPVTYIAFDAVNATDRFAGEYSAADVEEFNRYLDGQLDKVDLPDITEEERAFMRRAILGMYANPLRNQLTAKGEAVKSES